MENIRELVKNAAGVFLYIFINPGAGLNKTIMRKREKQIILLKRIATDSGVSYIELEQAVRDGLFEVFGKEPAEILTDIYNDALLAQSKINGKFDWSILVDFLEGVDNSLDYVVEKPSSNNTSSTTTVTTTAPDKKDWTDSANWMSTLPFVAAGGILLFLLVGSLGRN